MKSKIKQILNTITPQDLEDGCSRQVEEIMELLEEIDDSAYEDGYNEGYDDGRLEL